MRARLKTLLGPKGVAAVRRARALRRRLRLLFTERWRPQRSLLVPASRNWGIDRGTPIDRYYIEGFLEDCAGGLRGGGDIRGHVLEFGGGEYCRRFGNGAAHRDGVKRLDVVDLDPHNPEVTIAGDITKPETLPEDSYDCVICTEVLMLIYDVEAAIANMHRALRPSGVLLVTVGGIQQICRPEMDETGDYWRFTSGSIMRLLQEAFPPDRVTVETYGNVRSATAFLYGRAAEELPRGSLDYRDPDFEVTVAARAVKSG